MVFAVLLVGVVGVGAMMAYPQYAKARELDRQRGDVLRRIDEKEHELALVREKQRRFSTDPEFVESLARKNNLVYPGEVVFEFND